VSYSLDTSGILDMWSRDYPPDVFPTIWGNMDAAAKSGGIWIVEEVVRELERKEDGIHSWVKQREMAIVPIDDAVKTHLAEIMKKHGRLVDTRKNKSGGDPWVIALARARGLTVVTGENPTGTLTRPKIPDVCKDLGIPCIAVIDFFRKQGWRV
jgi:hypothetical protein